MPDRQDSEFKCERCGSDVKDEDQFCPSCGAIFKEGLVCFRHNSTPAEGVCVICSKPYCHHCGALVNKIFLCDPHSEYECYEGMARVFGHFDNLQAQPATNCLSQTGLHPFLYSRHVNPLPDRPMTAIPRLYGRHTIAEMKVLVPFAEVLEAEKVLSEVGLTSIEQE